MNCQDCIFSTRRVIVNQYVDWCSHNKSQKEITKDTMICDGFIQRKKTNMEIANVKEVKEVDKGDTQQTISDTQTPLNQIQNASPRLDLSTIDRRELAFEAEKAIERLRDREDIQDELTIVRAFLTPIIENEREKEFKEKLHITTSYKKFAPTKEISKIINVLNNSIHHYQSAQEDIKKYQRGQQDILHAFELTDLSDEELMEYTKELRELRMLRRQAKNFVETLEPLYQFSLKNKTLINNLKKVNSEIDKVKTSVDSRKYYVREKTTLQQAFEEAEPLHKRMNEIVSL